MTKQKIRTYKGRRKLGEVYRQLQPCWDYMNENIEPVRHPTEDLEVRELVLGAVDPNTPAKGRVERVLVQLTNREATVFNEMDYSDVPEIGYDVDYEPLFAYRKATSKDAPQRHSWMTREQMTRLRGHSGAHCWEDERKLRTNPREVVSFESEDANPTYVDSSWVEKLLGKVEDLNKPERS